MSDYEFTDTEEQDEEWEEEKSEDEDDMSKLESMMSSILLDNEEEETDADEIEVEEKVEDEIMLPETDYDIVKLRDDMKKIFGLCVTENNAKVFEISLFNMCIRSKKDFISTYKNRGYETYGKLKSPSKNLKTIRSELLNNVDICDAAEFTSFKDKKYLGYEMLEKPEDMNVEEGAFTCGRCGNMRIKIWTAQLRSGDESTTVSFTCIKCGNKWKT